MYAKPEKRLKFFKSLRCLLLPFLTAAFFLISVEAASTAETSDKGAPLARQRLKTTIVNNYYPYTFLNDSGAPAGFSVDIAQAVAAAMDLELEIRAGKWDQAVKELEAGRIDLLPMMAYSPERDRLFDFSVAHTIAYDAIFLNKGNSNLRSLKDLSGKTVIVMNNDAAHSYLLSSGLSKAMNLNVVDSLPEALQQLAAGKGDAAIMPKLVGMLTAKKLDLTGIETSPQLIDAYTRPFSFAVKDGNQALLERLSQGLNIIKSTGQYDVIYKKWFGALEDPHVHWKTAMKYGAVAVLILLVFIAWNIVLKRRVKSNTAHLEAEIAQRIMNEQALRDSEKRFRAILENAPIGISVVSLEGRFTLVNRSLCEIVGYEKEELEMLTFQEITHHDDLEANLANVQRLLDGSATSYHMEKRYVRKDQRIVWTQLTSSVVKDAAGTPLYLVAQIEDITDRRRSREQILQLAYYDALTGLPNRRLLKDRLRQLLAKAKRFQCSLALMFLDLDNFKQVNDTLGHDVGDELLKVVAGRLQACVRAMDTVCRQGGDEFIIVLSEISQPGDAGIVANKIINAINEPVTLNENDLRITISIGIAVYPVNGTDDAKELMKKADIAMYEGKKNGRNRFAFYQYEGESP